MAINKTFSVRHGLDVANTIVLDSERNLSNVNVANVHTINANTFVTVAGFNVVDQANAAYAQANLAYDAANNAKVTVFANNASNVTTQNLNFVNTATVTVVVSPDGSNANVEFIAAPQTIVLDSYFDSGNVTAAATANIANGLYQISTSAFEKANAPITVREIYATNANIVNSFANINTLQFDTESGMAVVDESNNTVTIKLNSTFKFWEVDGNPGLEAFGLDTVNFIAGNNITIQANNNASPKSITFSANSGVATIISDRFTGTGACTTFTLTNSSRTDAVFVYISGVSQRPSVDYQINDKTLTFNVAPFSNSSIEVRSLSDINLTNVSTVRSTTFTGNAVANVFTLPSSDYTTNAVFVFIDGVTQVPTIDYNVFGNSLLFGTPPEDNAVIEVRSLDNVQLANLNSITKNQTSITVDDASYSFHANGFSSNTDCIHRTYIMRCITTNNTETEMFLSGTSNRIPVNSNTTIFYSADIVARRTDAADESSGFHLKGVVDNFSNTVADVGSLYELVVAEDDADWAVDARADDTNNSINIYVTGENSKTIRWTALVKTVEVAQ
jgi:predicted metallopeptidase